MVAGASLLALGWNPEGLAAAARNTARFSGFVFALALVARSARWPLWFANRWALFFAFIAAHGVHFTAVALLAIFDTGHKLHRLEPVNIGTLVVGFTLVLLAAVTAGSASAPFLARKHTVFFYALGAIFLIGFGMRALNAPASAVLFAVVLLAFLARALPAKSAAELSVSA